VLFRSAALKHEGVLDVPLLVYGENARIIPKGAEVLSDFRSPMFIYHSPNTPPSPESIGPAITRHHYGKGTVLVIVPPLATDFYSRGHTQCRVLLNALVENYCPAPLIKLHTEAPVEITIHRKTGKHIVQLVHLAVPPRSWERPFTVDKIPRVHKAVLKFRIPMRAACVMADGTRRKVSSKAEDHFVVPDFRSHFLVELQPESVT
jgi:hypothetical protein